VADDVLITPASRKIEFKDADGNVDAVIQTDSSGNLAITNTGGDVSIGDTTSDVYIGDGTNNVDIVFEQDGEIRGTSGVTVTLGASGATTNLAGTVQLGGTTLTATGAELNYTDGVTSNIQTQLNAKLASSSYTASDVLTKIKTVDGTGSGLDADTLDGSEATAFATAAQGSTADSALQNISEDTTPQLGGSLDCNGHGINVDQGDIVDIGGLSLETFNTYNTAVIATDGVTSNSLYICPDAGNNVYIRNGVNALFSSETMATFLANGAVSLYYNNAAKLATTASGVDITGNLGVTGTVDGRDVATDGTKLDGIEASADVTDATNVASAGALMTTGGTMTGDLIFDRGTYTTTLTSDNPASANQTVTFPDATGTVVLNTNLNFPFFQADGTSDTIALTADSKIPFTQADGTANNIPLTT